MFRKVGPLLVAACLLLPFSARAEQVGVYVAPKFVLNVQHSKTELSYLGQHIGSDSKTAARAGGALAIGYDFAPAFDVPVRAELEYGAYGRISRTSGEGDHSVHAKVGLQTLLASVYWDITTWHDFTPYIGAGLGMAFLKTEGDVNHTGISADIGYRFLTMDNGDVSGIADAMKLNAKDNYVHQFMTGLRVTF